MYVTSVLKEACSQERPSVRVHFLHIYTRISLEARLLESCYHDTLLISQCSPYSLLPCYRNPFELPTINFHAVSSKYAAGGSTKTLKRCITPTPFLLLDRFVEETITTIDLENMKHILLFLLYLALSTTILSFWVVSFVVRE